MTENNPSLLNKVFNEAKSITQRIAVETGKTYRSFRTNLDIVNLKKRRRERLADLGFKVFASIREGKISIPGVEYLVSELKALDFQITLKEEDLIEQAAADAGMNAQPPETDHFEETKTKAEAGDEAEEPEEKNVEEQSNLKASSAETVTSSASKDDTSPSRGEGTVESQPEQIKTVRLESTSQVNASSSQGTEDAIRELITIKGIGEKLAPKLVDGGFDSIEKIALADENKLADAIGISTRAVQKYIIAAKEVLDRK